MAHQYNKGFRTLMGEAGILSAESFDLYITDVVGFGNSQDMDLDGFSWDPYSSITFDFKQLLMSNKLKVMATYADKDSEVIPIGTKGFQMTEGVIPCQKARFFWDSDDYRNYLDALSKINFQNGTAREYALDLLFNGLTDIKNAHELSMLYQRDQMVSNRGLVLDANNNPRGIKGLVFMAAVPEENITTTANMFSDPENKSAETANLNVDLIAVLKRTIRNMVRKKGWDKSTIIMEVDEMSFLDDMEHPVIRRQIGYRLRRDLLMTPANDANALIVGNNADDDEVKAAFAGLIGLPLANIKFKKGLTAVERLSGKGVNAKLVTTAFRTFNANTYVLYPAGPLGTIKTAMALIPDGDAIYATFFEGRGIIQYEYDAKAKTQDWWSEFYGLCVPTRPQEMYYVITYTTPEGSGSGSGSGSGEGA